MYQDIKKWLLLLIIALIFGGLGYWLSINQPSAALKVAKVYPSPRTIQPFHLLDTSNQAFTEKNLQGQWSLLFFGFTNCPDVCPNTLNIMNQIDTLLTKKEKPSMVFVSVDPERDTTNQLKTYLNYFNHSFLGATGDNNELLKLTKQLGVIYVKDFNNNSDFYTIDHTTTLFLINPNGQLVAQFSMPHIAADIATDIETLIPNLH